MLNQLLPAALSAVSGLSKAGSRGLGQASRTSGIVTKPVPGAQSAAPSWQSERVTALRDRFSRPGAASRMPVRAPMNRAPMPVVQKPAPVANPPAADIQAYADAWNQDVGNNSGPG